MLNNVPDHLNAAVIQEYGEIVSFYRFGKWRSSELHGGRFAEVCYTIVEGLDGGKFAGTVQKPPSFRDACGRLRNSTVLSKSIRFLVLPILEMLIEVRNVRDVAHVSSILDPSEADAYFIFTQASYALTELVRVCNSSDALAAQRLIRKLVNFPTPYVYDDNGYKRVLHSGLKLDEEILILLHSTSGEPISVKNLSEWTGQKNTTYIRKRLKELDGERFLRFNTSADTASILPPGVTRADGTLNSLVT